MISRFVFLSFFVACGIARAETPTLLATAVEKFAQSDDDWAYTQVFHRTDRTSGDTVAHFDPSKRSGEQWQLIMLRGKTPSDSEAATWCKRRQQNTNQSDSRAFIDLLDLDHASVVDEQKDNVRFEIPLKKNTIAHVPTENFIAYAEVDRADKILQHMSIVLKQAIRLIGGIAEVQTAEGEVVFQSIGVAESRPTLIVAKGSGQALFRRVNRSAEITFLDQRRVKS